MAAKKMKLLDRVLEKAGTTSGAIISIITIFGFGTAIGFYLRDVKRDIEILELKRDNFFEVKDLNEKLDYLELDNYKLKEKISEYEKICK